MKALLRRRTLSPVHIALSYTETQVWDPDLGWFQPIYPSLERALLKTYDIGAGDWILLEAADSDVLALPGQMCPAWLRAFGRSERYATSRKWKITAQWSDSSPASTPPKGRWAKELK